MNSYENSVQKAEKEQAQKIKIIRDIFPKYVKAVNPKDTDHGLVFDKLYDKDLSYLIILKEMYK